MTNAAKKIELLDTLTNAVTASRTWGEFKAALVTGYVPTIRSRKLTKNASLKSRAYEKAVAMFRDAVRAEGFKVFDGNKVA